jgi:hypothetical protein
MPISPRTKRTILNSHASLITNSNFSKRRRSNIQKKKTGLIENTLDLDGCTISSRNASSTVAYSRPQTSIQTMFHTAGAQDLLRNPQLTSKFEKTRVTSSRAPFIIAKPMEAKF